ncbi:AAA family ATPase [Halorarius halobius]|uniref:AAA family ATPase n=1 Tax=Halorarius halobius TaxID=2962671 RepID=UPI0020CE2690|nr:AAA family ATPase [Halorarius halobius]
MLIVVCGLPGAGKTTVSEAIADRLDAVRLRTDVVRKDVLADPDYTPEETRRVYAELLDRGRERLDDGERVVLDGTFKRGWQRKGARTAADDTGVPFQLVRVDCDETTVRERIAAREGDESDADFEVHRIIREEFEPLRREHAVVDNSGSLEETMEQVDALVDRATPRDSPGIEQ